MNFMNIVPTNYETLNIVSHPNSNYSLVNGEKLKAWVDFRWFKDGFTKLFL